MQWFERAAPDTRARLGSAQGDASARNSLGSAENFAGDSTARLQFCHRW
jgi:hypothetical protein